VRTKKPTPETSWPKAVDRFLSHLQAAERSGYTQKNYREDLRIFAEWWPGHTAEELGPAAITSIDLREFKAHLVGRALKPATVNAKLSALRSFLAWSAKSGLIERVPDAPRHVRKAPEEPKWLPRRELLGLLREVDRHGSLRDRALFDVMLNTGVRVAELVALTWRDVEISPRKGELTIRSGKGSKWRTVPLNRAARDAFDNLGFPNKINPTAKIFKGQRGPLTVRGIQDLVGKLGARAGLPDLTPHQLRHTFAKTLLEAGTHITTVARLLGHESIQTTMRYLTPSGTDLQGAVDRLDRVE
jgi:site-specific recombinase XerD